MRCVRQFLRKNLTFFLWVTAGALCLRLLILYKLGLVTGDSLLYSDIAKNLLNHGSFAQTATEGVRPTLVRLPGYPFFLAFIFAIFGQDHFRVVMVAQAIIDIGTCLLVADIARRIISEKAARIAFLLAAFCPFVANYTATPLTEAPSVFFLTLAVQQAIIALDSLPQQAKRRLAGDPDRLDRFRLPDAAELADSPGMALDPATIGKRPILNWIYCGLALAVSIVLRPDGGLMLGAIGLILLYRIFRPEGSSQRVEAHGEGRHQLPLLGQKPGLPRRKPLVAGGLVMTFVALVPLVPWTIRNWRVMHVFQPLVTFEATDPGEFIARGWDRWLRTWLVDYSNIEDVAFHVDGEAIDIQLVPSRAFDSPAEREYVASLFAQYNQTKRMNADLDRRFGELAQQKIRRHPVRYYLELPVLRLLDMWFRPRIELLPFDSHWWTFRVDRWNTIGACLIGLLNLLLVASAVIGIFRGEPMRHWGLVLVYPVVRSLFLLTIGTAEDRYTIECFPFIYLLATRWLASFGSIATAIRAHSFSHRS